MSSSSCCEKTKKARYAQALRVTVGVCCLLAGLSLTQFADAAGWRADVPQARLRGEADFRLFGFKVYHAALWSTGATFDPAQPFALELTYQRSIGRARIVRSSIDEIRRLFGERYSEQQLQRWEAEMNAAFTDVEEGDQLTGVYLPGIGCRFYNSKQLLAEVRDVEFAQAFFAIWLDPRSRDAQLRRRLLGASP
ncbi:chalcone isomerase family protein [Herbaspirillum rhizosphaerae]|uniref:Chalcone isomerase family protein n=1 Tax=Herbaspirillum rhizosphaerae TaxID=346179 RepID=A0ABW8ZC78_9BURK